MGTDIPIVPILIFIGALCIAFFARPSGGGESTPAADPSNPTAPNPIGSHAIGSLSAGEHGPTGIATALYLMGMLALMLGGLIFAFADTSPHEILATEIGIMGAIFFAAGAVVTELQRIKRRLDADAAERRAILSP